jgi:hypothetical protein
LKERVKDSAISGSPASVRHSHVYLCSAPRLRNGVEDWKDITPQPFQRAVEALRKDFKKQAWKVSHIMTRGCHPALHKGLAEQARKISRPMEQQLGHAPLPTVDEGQTEPVVFSSYFYRCADLLAGALRRTFFNLRDIALAQSTLINGSPVDWTEIQAKVLVADESHGISLWLKCTCDGSFEFIDEDLDVRIENGRFVEAWQNWNAAGLYTQAYRPAHSFFFLRSLSQARATPSNASPPPSTNALCASRCNSCAWFNTLENSSSPRIPSSQGSRTIAG